ncbi:MAG: tetratricopeptide (TPR) repeat protein, partial [Phenylobacterium sp.]
RGDYDTALNYLQRALAIAQSIGDIVREGVTCWNLGMQYERRGDLPQAIDYISRSLVIRTKTEHPDTEKTAQHLADLQQRLADAS